MCGGCCLCNSFPVKENWSPCIGEWRTISKRGLLASEEPPVSPNFRNDLFHGHNQATGKAVNPQSPTDP